MNKAYKILIGTIVKDGGPILNGTYVAIDKEAIVKLLKQDALKKAFIVAVKEGHIHPTKSGKLAVDWQTIESVLGLKAAQDAYDRFFPAEEEVEPIVEPVVEPVVESGVPDMLPEELTVEEVPQDIGPHEEIPDSVEVPEDLDISTEKLTEEDIAPQSIIGAGVGLLALLLSLVGLFLTMKGVSIASIVIALGAIGVSVWGLILSHRKLIPGLGIGLGVLSGLIGGYGFLQAKTPTPDVPMMETISEEDTTLEDTAIPETTEETMVSDTTTVEGETTEAPSGGDTSEGEETEAPQEETTELKEPSSDLFKNIKVEMGEFKSERDEFRVLTSALPLRITNLTNTEQNYNLAIQAYDADNNRVGEPEFAIRVQMKPGETIERVVYEFITPETIEKLSQEGITFKLEDITPY